MIKTNKLTTSKPGVIKAHTSTIVPYGYLLCDGLEVAKSLYPQLWNYIGTTYGTASNPLNIKLPDLRAEFVRGVDYGRGLDPGRMLGTNQIDTFQSHQHGYNNYSGPPSLGGSTGGGPVAVSPNVTSTDGGTETRPVNSALIFIIKV